MKPSPGASMDKIIEEAESLYEIYPNPGPSISALGQLLAIEEEVDREVPVATRTELPKLVIGITLFTSERALEVVLEARRELREEYGIHIDFEIQNVSLVGVNDYDADDYDAVVWFGDKKIDIMPHIEYDDEYYNIIKNNIIISVIKTITKSMENNEEYSLLLVAPKKKPMSTAIVVAS